MATRFSLDFSNSGDLTQPCISGARAESLINIRKFLKQLNAGGFLNTTSVVVRNSAAAATGTLTLASVAAGTIVEVNGVDFIARSGTVTAGNNEFDMSGDDTADAVALAAAINASTSTGISGVVTASSALGVVTVTSVAAGLTPNGVMIRTRGVRANGTVTVASITANDTVTINGTALTSKQQRATGTLTASTAIVGTTCVINGVTFTGVAGAVTLGQNTFSIDTGNTETATSLAAQINASTDPNIAGLLTATSATNVVTLRAVTAGTAGNALTLVGTVTVLAASAATLTGGIAVANNEFEAKGTDAQIATDMARAINASTTALVSGQVKAVARAAVVYLYSRFDGVRGNNTTLASIDNTRLAVSAARLAGGTTASSAGAQAAIVLTLSGGSGNYTVTINGVNASGTVAFNTSDTQTCADLADAINKSTNALVAEQVTATASTTTLTITAIHGGLTGNATTIACTGTGLTIAGSATRLLAGAVPTTVVASGERLASGAETKFTLSY